MGDERLQKRHGARRIEPAGVEVAVRRRGARRHSLDQQGIGMAAAHPLRRQGIEIGEAAGLGGTDIRAVQQPSAAGRQRVGRDEGQLGLQLLAQTLEQWAPSPRICANAVDISNQVVERPVYSTIGKLGRHPDLLHPTRDPA
jgi:hypothetical protein